VSYQLLFIYTVLVSGEDVILIVIKLILRMYSVIFIDFASKVVYNFSIGLWEEGMMFYEIN